MQEIKCSSAWLWPPLECSRPNVETAGFYWDHMDQSRPERTTELRLSSVWKVFTSARLCVISVLIIHQSRQTSSPICLFVSSITFLQPTADTPTEQEEGAVHLAAVRCQHRPADHDPHLTQLAGGLHQQLPLQLGRQQLLRTPFSRWDQVISACA